MIELAKSICKMAHEGQYDKGGNPYYLHPFAVADMCEKENEKTVAYLHDVIEDTSLTKEKLKALGFDNEILVAVDLLTKKPNQTYEQYLSEIKGNSIARAVKINDMTHNSDLSRLKTITEVDLQRKEKYKNGIKFLKG